MTDDWFRDPLTGVANGITNDGYERILRDWGWIVPYSGRLKWEPVTGHVALTEILGHFYVSPMREMLNAESPFLRLLEQEKEAPTQ